MDIRSRHIDRFYFFSFVAVLVFLPWSVRLCSYALVVFACAGLLTTGVSQKLQQLRQHPQVLVFIVLYALYILGLLYADDLADGFQGLEQKIALLVVPLIAASSIPFTDRQRENALRLFVYSHVVLTLTCVVLNVIMLASEEPYLQMNFDFHTLARFNNLHSDISPIWMQISYIAFSSFFIGPTYLSVYLTLCILILFHYDIIQSKYSYLKYVLAGWFCIVVILLASRMGILLFAGVTSVNLLYHFFKDRFYRQGILTSVGLTVGVLLLILISPVTRFRVIEEPLATPLQIPSNHENWNSVNLRLLEWEASVEGIKEHGIKGTGTGGTLDALHSHYEKVHLGDLDMRYNAHNQYLETYLEIGLAGFVVWLLCLAFPLMKGITTRNTLLVSVVILVAVGCLTTSMFEKARGLLFYTAFVSLFMFTTKTEKHEHESEK